MQHPDVTEGDDVTLRVPPYSEFLRTVRLVAADMAARASLDCEDVEDFRIAIDELCSLLMRSTDHAIELSFGVCGDAVVAHGRARGRDGASLAPHDDLSRTILESVADWFETGTRDSFVEFSLVKRPCARSRRT